MKKRIKLFDPFVGKEEEKDVISTLRTHNWASGSGNFKVHEFEEKFRKYIGSSYCIAVNSGTAALHLALSLMNIRNKEVILPSLSFVATAHAVIMNGGKPVFVDVDPKTLCIDTNKIESVLNKNTRVILPVHFGGHPCEINHIKKLCARYMIKCVDDAAHATGSTYHGKKIGSFNFVTCFSFHPVKNLAMPTGGAITLSKDFNTNHEKILKSRRWCGISTRKGHLYEVREIGWNYYMNEFSASIGLTQLKKLNKIISIKQAIAKRYSQEIKLIEKMSFSKDCSYHLYWIQVKNRTKFMKFMNENNIETGIHYKPIHKMKFYNKTQRLPITEKIGEKIVSIPIHANLSNSEVTRIIKLINSFS